MSSTGPSPKAIVSVTALYAALLAKARPLVDKFESRYAAWKETWTSLDEQEDKFVKLTNMGVKILPLVVHKLCDETETRAVELYNAIEKDSRFKGESRAAIITRNQDRNDKFTAYAADWEVYKENCFSNNSQAYRLCGEYLWVVDLGPGIVSHAMLAYYDDYGGWWDLLLCELLSGSPSGAWVLVRKEIQQRWIEWFESEAGDADAPYKLVGEAKRVELWMREAGMGRDYVTLGEDGLVP